jgi:hypothetical protein
MLSTYCRDLDGNPIEIFTYAKDSIGCSGTDPVEHDAEFDTEA